MYGKVIRLVKDRGFGFLKSEEGGDVFFHLSSVQREPGFSFETMEEGDEVEFDLGSSDKGPRAENITRA